MKPMFFLFLVFFLVGCQETTKRYSNCNQSPYGCNGSYSNGYGNGSYNAGYNAGTNSGYNPYNPYDPYNPGNTVGGTVGGYYPGPNPFPNYYSGYVDKNWLVHYPHIPSINCSEAVAPSGIDYTPHETRKGTVTVKGQVNYDPASGQQFFDTTSELLRNTNGTKNFFWGDSVVKVRFKANPQPESRNTTAVCPGRATGQSSIKGYGKIRFDLYLVGKKANGTTSTISLGKQEVKINACTSAINLSNYAEQFPGGMYLKVSNVQSNQNWMPGTYPQQQAYDLYGYVTPQNPYVEATWGNVRNAECWSLDFEVAADGTKTFN